MVTRVKVRIRLWRCPHCGRVLETVGEEVRCKCGGWMELVGAVSQSSTATRRSSVMNPSPS